MSFTTFSLYTLMQKFKTKELDKLTTHAEASLSLNPQQKDDYQRTKVTELLVSARNLAKRKSIRVMIFEEIVS